MLIEPPCQQDLIGQRTAADVPDRVEQVAHVEEWKGGDHAEPRECRAGDENPGEQQPSWTESIDDPSRREPEQRADDQLAVGVPRGDLLPGPPVLAYEEVIEERQAVECDADNREQRQKGRRCDV